MRKFFQIIAATFLASFTCLAVANAGPLTVNSGGDWSVFHYGTLGYSNYDPANAIGALEKMRDKNTYRESVGTRVYGDQEYPVGSAWKTPTGDAKWIGPWNGESGTPENTNSSYTNPYGPWNEAGYYAFSTTFTVEGLMNGAVATLLGELWKDNALIGIDLIGLGDNIYNVSFDLSKAQVADLDDYQTSTGYNFEGLTNGEYMITFYITNGLPDGDGKFGWTSDDPVALGPTGMMTTFTVDTAATPEPATMAIVGLGALGGLIAARRRLRK